MDTKEKVRSSLIYGRARQPHQHRWHPWAPHTFLKAMSLMPPPSPCCFKVDFLGENLVSDDKNGDDDILVVMTFLHASHWRFHACWCGPGGCVFVVLASMNRQWQDLANDFLSSATLRHYLSLWFEVSCRWWYVWNSIDTMISHGFWRFCFCFWKKTNVHVDSYQLLAEVFNIWGDISSSFFLKNQAVIMYFAIFRPANFITIRSRVFQEKEDMNSIMLKKKFGRNPE